MKGYCMQKSIAAFIFLVVTGVSSAHAAQAFWTGRSEQVQTVTYKWVWQCEYDYLGQKFWRLFERGCASSVEVQ